VKSSQHIYFASLEFVIAAASAGIWIWLGSALFLFLSGVATGCGFIMACFAWAERKAEKAERRERIG